MNVVAFPLSLDEGDPISIPAKISKAFRHENALAIVDATIANEGRDTECMLNPTSASSW